MGGVRCVPLHCLPATGREGGMWTDQRYIGGHMNRQAGRQAGGQAGR